MRDAWREWAVGLRLKWHDLTTERRDEARDLRTHDLAAAESKPSNDRPGP